MHVAPLQPELDVEVGEVFGYAGFQALAPCVDDPLGVVLAPLAFRLVDRLQISNSDVRFEQSRGLKNVDVAGHQGLASWPTILLVLC